MAQTNREVQTAARRRALDVRNEIRQARLERDRRLEDLATTAQVALLERHMLVQAAEQRAGEAIRTMIEDEGLALRDAVGWIGSDLTIAEARRLRNVAAEDNKARAAVEGAQRASAARPPGTQRDV